MFIISVLNGFCFLLFIISFHCSNNHFVEVRNTRFNSACLLKGLLSICRKQVDAGRTVRIFEASWSSVKSFEAVKLQKPFKQFSLTSEFKSPMIRILS